MAAEKPWPRLGRDRVCSSDRNQSRRVVVVAYGDSAGGEPPHPECCGSAKTTATTELVESAWRCGGPSNSHGDFGTVAVGHGSG